MNHNKKIAIILKQNLLEWQKLNVTAFLASSVAIQFPETHGKKFVNSTGSEFLPFINQPILIYKADDNNELKRVFNRAKERELAIGIYTEPLFATRTEEENLVEILNQGDHDQPLVGIVIYGDNNKVTKALDKLKLHP